MKLGQYLLSALIICNAAFAADDTEATRTIAANRYLAAVPLSELMDDLVEQMGKNMPQDKRSQIHKILAENFDFKTFESIIKASIIKHFDTNEINAMADFYSSPVGKSVMKKFGSYMADVMPPLQTEIVKAVKKSTLNITPSQ